MGDILTYIKVKFQICQLQNQTDFVISIFVNIYNFRIILSAKKPVTLLNTLFVQYALKRLPICSSHCLFSPNNSLICILFNLLQVGSMS